MKERSTPRTIDEYVSAAPLECRPILENIRKTIRESAPRAEETISYGMPALRQKDILVYFAAFKKHIGLYPPVRGDEKLMRDVAPYAGAKGNLRFPLDKAIPYELIQRIVKARVQATTIRPKRDETSAGLKAPSKGRGVGIKPKLLKRETHFYAGVSKTLPRDKLSEVVSRCLSTVLAFLQKHRVDVTGAPLIRYFVVDYNTGEIEIDIGVPIGKTALPADALVHCGQIPSGTFATVIHRGPYGTLIKRTAALMDWAQQNNVIWSMVEQRKVTRWDGRVEHYLVGPPDEPKSKNWRTEIAILLG